MRPQIQAIAALAALGLLFSALSPARAEDNPLAPAEQGKIACYKPNLEKKTCWVMAAFSKREDGTYENSFKARFSNTVDYETRAKTVSSVKDGKLCSTFERSQYENARFFHLGDEVIKQDLDELRKLVVEGLKDKFGKEYCDRLGPPDEKGISKVTSFVDGVEQLPGYVLSTMTWINPGDGFKLRPPSE